MSSLVEELWDYTQKSGFNSYHMLYKGPHDPNKVLRGFLYATMNEVRFRYANEYATMALKIVDMDDADHFRKGLLRREVSGNISYEKHRDHSAHTLYNYLMGWYIYQHNDLIKINIAKHFQKRGLDRGLDSFANLWPFASLLHDVGYLFEGSISPLDSSIQDEQINIGVEVAQDYFSHRFWTKCGLDSVYYRDLLRKLSGVKEPLLSRRSIAELGDTLRGLGDLEKLRISAKDARDKKGCAAQGRDCLGEKNGLPGDAFDLWHRHFIYYDERSMAKRIDFARKVFESLMYEGREGNGLRLLDHGICSGLLILLYSTFYFRTYFGLKKTPPSDKNDKIAWKLFMKQVPKGVRYDSLWWWASVVSVTASVAIHSIQTMKWPSDFGRLKKLSVNEDPMGYLGILVDCIQEWDRSSVSHHEVIGGFLPLQGKDVDLSAKSGKVVIRYPDKAIAKKVKINLDNSLLGWDHVVSIK